MFKVSKLLDSLEGLEMWCREQERIVTILLLVPLSLSMTGQTGESASVEV